MGQDGTDYSGLCGPISLPKQGYPRAPGRGLPSITFMSKGWPEMAFGKANDSTLAKADQPVLGIMNNFQEQIRSLVTRDMLIYLWF